MRQTRTFCLLVLIFVFSAASNVLANSIAVTYNLTGVGTVQSATDTTLMLLGQFSGSVLSSNPNLDIA